MLYDVIIRYDNFDIHSPVVEKSVRLFGIDTVQEFVRGCRKAENISQLDVMDIFTGEILYSYTGSVVTWNLLFD